MYQKNHPKSLRVCQGLLKNTLGISWSKSTKVNNIHQVKWKQVISTINLADMHCGGLSMSNMVPSLSIPSNYKVQRVNNHKVPFGFANGPLSLTLKMDEHGLNRWHWQHQERHTGMVVRYSNDLNWSSCDKALRILQQTLLFLHLFPRRPTGSYCKSRASKGQPLHPSLRLWWLWPAHHAAIRWTPELLAFRPLGDIRKLTGSCITHCPRSGGNHSPRTLQVPMSIPTCIYIK